METNPSDTNSVSEAGSIPDYFRSGPDEDFTVSQPSSANLPPPRPSEPSEELERFVVRITREGSTDDVLHPINLAVSGDSLEAVREALRATVRNTQASEHARQFFGLSGNSAPRSSCVEVVDMSFDAYLSAKLRGKLGPLADVVNVSPGLIIPSIKVAADLFGIPYPTLVQKFNSPKTKLDPFHHVTLRQRGVVLRRV